MSDHIVDLQRRDHDHLDRLLRRYEGENAVARRSTFGEIVKLVTTHAFAEEEILFPAARKALSAGDFVTTEIESEHQRINELIKAMERSHPGQEEFDARADELFPLLRSDVRNEEDRLLPALARVLEIDELERLGQMWLLAKKAAPNRAHPGIPRRPPGNVIAGIPLFFVDRLRNLFARLRDAPQ